MTIVSFKYVQPAEMTTVRQIHHDVGSNHNEENATTYRATGGLIKINRHHDFLQLGTDVQLDLFSLTEKETGKDRKVKSQIQDQSFPWLVR